MAKSGKLTICQIKSIQAKVKYSILLLQHSLKNYFIFRKWREFCGHIFKNPHLRCPSKLKTPFNTPHKNNPHLKTNNTSAKCLIPDVRQSSGHTAE